MTGTFAGITIGAAIGKSTGAGVTIATGDPIGEIGNTGDDLGVAIGAFVIIPIIIWPMPIPICGTLTGI